MEGRRLTIHTRAKPLHLYLVGTGSWFVSNGIQLVLFAYLVTMVLDESPAKIGMAQMAMLLPATCLLLIGGSLADRLGGRAVALVAQTAALLPPSFLLLMLAGGRLSYAMLIAYAVVMGTIQAFVTPARDGLLNQIADGRIQRTVIQVSMIQFGVQVLGFALASTADRFGVELVLACQIAALGIGALAWRRLPAPSPAATDHGPGVAGLVHSIREGSRAALGVPAIRSVLLVNIAMAMFFMGSYIVSLPILIREIYAGSSADLASMNAANSLGLLSTIVILYRLGDIRNKGRALILAQVAGALFLALTGLGFDFGLLLAVLFVWGGCGGVAMSMARTIVQELAADGLRARVMAFFSLSLLGAGPVGALLSGYLVELVGVQRALMASAGAMLCVATVVAATSGLWRAAAVDGGKGGDARLQPGGEGSGVATPVPARTK